MPRRKSSSDQPGLYVVSDGEIIGRTPTLRELLAKIDELELTVQDLERERRYQRREISKLKAELDDSPLHYDRADEVASIVNEWREICNHPRARLDLARFQCVRRLLDVVHPKPYPREAFTWAFRGAAFDPFRKRMKNGKIYTYDDITLICRDAEHFESFIRRAPRPRV